MSYIHLHVQSAYSLLSSTATVEQLVSSAKQKGFTAIALTDRNVMYGAISFYKECLKQSIKPILGLTVDVISEMDEEKAYPLVLLANNQKGFKNLLKITSVVQTKSPLGIPIKWLKHYSEGITAISPGLDGEIERFLLDEDENTAMKIVEIYKQTFEPNQFYLAIQNLGITEQEKMNSQLQKLGSAYGVELVATNPVYYLAREDSFAHECVLSIKNGDKLQDELRERLPSDQYYLKDTNEVVEGMSAYPDALENTLAIAERCNVMLELNQQHLPKYPVSEGESAASLLEKICWKGLQERFSEVGIEHKQRLQYELSVIQKMNFSDYFLIVWDFMRFAREREILTGPGRGSAAGSIVAYVLYITDVDPIKHELLFERFLNPERISMPDIDIDFPDNRRDEVIDYVVHKYGELHVAQIITFGTLAAKAAIRDVGRVFGLNPKELDTVSKYIPSRLGITLKEAYQESESLRNFIRQSDMNKRLFETALKLEGLPRHTSTHAAGVIISEQPLIQMVPIQEGHNHVYLTQYSMEHLESVGLLKMDFLGLRNLSLIENIVASIQRATGKKLEIQKIPLEDEKTFALLSKGNTTGVFQLESDGMRSVLKRLRPNQFEDIVAVNALYRPGPMENIPLYINRKHGKELVSYPHADLQAILQNTYGVIVYQEQIMQIASKMAGFSLGEADLLRRAVGKKQKHVLDKERAHFVRGSVQKGYSEETANSIYDLIVRFANYGFNRSHAVAYSFIAYQLAYLKAHYPQHFMAALLTSAIGNEGKLSQYIRELKQMDFPILPPSINYSGYTFMVDKQGIRYSLSAIKGIGMTVLKEIFQARKNKKFADLFDFCIRVSKKAINRKTMEILVHSGSFDEFGEDRAVLLASLDVALDHAQLVKPDDSDQGDLFSEEDFMLKPKYVNVDPIQIEDKLQLEKEALGLYLSDHPVSVYESSFLTLGAKPLVDLAGKATTVAYVSEIKKIRTKKGDAMAFLTISDQSGEMEAVVFPTVFKRISHLLAKGVVLYLQGKIEEKDGRSQFIVQLGEVLESVLERATPNEATLYLKIEQEVETEEQLTILKALLRQHQGNIPCILYYASSKRMVRLSQDDRIVPSPQLLDQLKEILGDSNVILKS
ncbi:DNA polymerase III subunit alpha [Cytobacillus spongiae]|uniref:DNA polymerase III subunit alpha n=1 Tax=Cytobacillus spongiae TaxID=2901381 RepID=UPI001F2A99CB|nr:DNA polymerase III subunit alpha [Cytobacillus spongiae]UII55162.1 DNA polymerase III subunit alpha [Cytobacillus spongiae]